VYIEDGDANEGNDKTVALAAPQSLEYADVSGIEEGEKVEVGIAYGGSWARSCGCERRWGLPRDS
jgi:hypothetical protein